MISAPGKVLWIGSYSVVFGGISHVIAINKRVRCTKIGEDKLFFETSYGNFTETGNPIIESVIAAFKEKFQEFPNIHVKLINDYEFQINGKKTGLGSSSASTVALTACAYMELKGKINLEEIHEIAQRANFIRQKGIGSGFDIAAAVFGSLIYKRNGFREPLGIGNYEILLGFTGKSSDTVKLVEAFSKRSEEEWFKEIISEIDHENETAIELLKMGYLDEASVHVKLGRDLLNYLAKRVGVELETENEKKLINLAEKNGAIISLSPGAGGGDVIMAIGEDLSKVREVWKNSGIYLIDVKEDGGLRID
ncbi:MULTISPECIES: phosphomevalonate kinase [Acidianus]|uniref:phosphomevalonate kinase n=1 Tax=Candidatus Acidianus copahuensis TaxID=1160895 RepID=A0A031LJT8_9CREN|nr:MULTISPECIES: phosphomevalonate kinase [Acidianus]EZQ01806.1 GHMP kinase [Candidatus Acidianus copahuensis]NON63533.1 GHMP kinase [Acidianus sp. RZ1]